MKPVDVDEPIAEPNAYAPPTSAASEPLEAQQVTVGQRLAGGLLILGAIVKMADTLSAPRLIDRWSLFNFTTDQSQQAVYATVLFFPFVLFVMDLVLGGLLLAKKKRAVRVTTIRLLLGMVCFSVMQLIYRREINFDLVFVFIELVASASLIVLLGVHAKRMRLMVGTTLYGINLLLNLWGIGVTMTGTNPFGAIIQQAYGNIEADPTNVVVGKLVPYKLTLPPDRWYLAANKQSGANETEVDRWVTRPDLDAHVTVIVEELQSGVDVPDDYTDAVVKHFTTTNHLTLRSRQPLRTHPDKGRLLAFQDPSKFEPNDSLVGVVTTYGYRFLIQASASRKVFPGVEPELRGIIESFELPPDKPLRAPADCEEQPVTRIEGLAQKYVLPVPGDRWYLRKTEAANKDNAAIDRWIVRPDKNAHIWVIVHQNRTGDMDLNDYTNAVANTIATEREMTLLSRETITSRPGQARLLKAKGHNDGTSYRYVYWIFVKGSYGYQVVAVAPWDTFDEFDTDFLRSVDGFEAP